MAGRMEPFLAGEKTRLGRPFWTTPHAIPVRRNAAAALYWLGRLMRSMARRPRRGAFYVLVGRRFANSYYAHQAQARKSGPHHSFTFILR
jgi:hypothetical protein